MVTSSFFRCKCSSLSWLFPLCEIISAGYWHVQLSSLARSLSQSHPRQWRSFGQHKMSGSNGCHFGAENFNSHILSPPLRQLILCQVAEVQSAWVSEWGKWETELPSWLTLEMYHKWDVNLHCFKILRYSRSVHYCGVIYTNLTLASTTVYRSVSPSLFLIFKCTE